MTHADIIIALADGTFLSADCGSDGYPDWVGECLLQQYTDPVKIKELIDIGLFSPIGDTPAETIEGNMYDPSDFEDGSGYPLKAATLADLDEVAGEHRYLWRENQWWYQTWGDNGMLPWVLLTTVDRTEFGAGYLESKKETT